MRNSFSLESCSSFCTFLRLSAKKRGTKSDFFRPRFYPYYTTARKSRELHRYNGAAMSAVKYTTIAPGTVDSLSRILPPAKLSLYVPAPCPIKNKRSPHFSVPALSVSWACVFLFPVSPRYSHFCCYYTKPCVESSSAF